MTRFRSGLIALVIAVLALAACSSHKTATTADSHAANGYSTAKGGLAADAATGLATAPNAPEQSSVKQAPPLQQSRDRVETATIAVNVKDVDSAADTMGAAAMKAGGRVDGDNRDSDTNGRHATVIIRVPADKLTDMLDKAKGLGDELNRTRTGEDMTAAHADINARIQALEDSVTRLSDFLKKTGSIDDLVRTENELTQRQSELDSARAQQRALADQISLATLTMTFTAKPVLTPLPVEKHGPLGFGSALAKGWHSIVVAARYTGAGAGYALPYAVLAVLFAMPLALAVRRRRSAPPQAAAD
jgi:hypothetical protein